MRLKSILATLLLLVAGLQTAQAQGFRVYKSDGTVAQFSLRTDSIVFYDGIGTDVDFGPFTPVNQCITGTWYKTKSESVTFREDGTTDYMQGATYEFMPYQGSVIIYNASGEPMNILKVHKVTSEMLILSTLGDNKFNVYSRTQPVQLVTSITLNYTSLNLKLNETRSLVATVRPENADNKEVEWTSSDEAVAVVGKFAGDIIVMAKSRGTCTITCSAMDGSGVKAECQVQVKNDESGTINGRDYVDLGLPSGTLWATCNVGANNPEEYGDYFAWGETTGYNGGKTDFTSDTYKYYNYDGSFYKVTKYVASSNFGTVDNKSELEPEDDAATANWGSGWQMPSLEQFNELINSSNTTTEWTTQNGVYGRKITSKSNGNFIFLPAAGYRWSGGLYYAGSEGAYWSCSLNTDHSGCAYELAFYSSDIDTFGDRCYRDRGLSVRPVRKQEPKEEHEYVNLGLPSGTLWATTNVGADTPEEYGDYFAWGETQPKEDYSWNTYKYYKYCVGSMWAMTKYCQQSEYGYNGFTDDLDELLPEDDAATMNWGSEWQMPSWAQLKELINSEYTITEWTTQNGVYGRKITSKSNGNTVFFPAAGDSGGTSLEYFDSYGNYWSRSLESLGSYCACDLFFDSSYIYSLNCSRCLDHSVRPVRVQN